MRICCWLPAGDTERLLFDFMRFERRRILTAMRYILSWEKFGTTEIITLSAKKSISLGSINVRNQVKFYEKKTWCNLKTGGGGSGTNIQQRNFNKFPFLDWLCSLFSSSVHHRPVCTSALYGPKIASPARPGPLGYIKILARPGPVPWW